MGVAVFDMVFGKGEGFVDGAWACPQVICVLGTWHRAAVMIGE